jgi:amino acid adenylation domain-containing protein/thioester reductase-like protein
MFSDRRCSIHELFTGQASQSPERLAVIAEGQKLTYQELNKKANQVAHYLQNLGAGPDTLVGICVDRSPQMLIALLGILKAGAAYVPLDPKYPQERLGFIIEDTQIKLLISQSAMAEILPLHQAQTLFLDAMWDLLEQQPTNNPENAVESHHLAYVIYTSGSTGRPKGVAIEHRNALDLAAWSYDYFEPDCWSGVLASTSICFDLSVFELFVTLGCGGTVILADNALELPKLSAAQQVKLINTVPSAIEALWKVQGIPDSVHTINLAGEPLQNALVQKLYQLDQVRAVYNLYGPSEDTTYSTAALIPQGATSVPTIGRPLPHSRVHLLDAQMRPVPEGLEGEIYIGGAGLARGYLNRPELTADCFIRDPFSKDPTDRLYRTGDLALYLPDGNLKFLGRIDHQVKIRGFRIELGEIENTLLLLSELRQVIIVARTDDGASNPRIIAYVVPEVNQGESITPKFLRNFLAKKLPLHMVPAAFVILPELPLTPNGKIDRRALPVPQWNSTEEGSSEPPCTPLECQLQAIWIKVLKVEDIGLHDTFCSLGGHSLMAIHLLYEVQTILGLDVPMSLFLESPTLAGMAAVIQMLQQNVQIAIDLATQQRKAQMPGSATEFEVGPVLSTPTTLATEAELAEQLDASIFPPFESSGPIPHIFLTGATGFLGTYLLGQLLQKTQGDIYCLVRATSLSEGLVRLRHSLNRYQLWQDNYEGRIIPVLGSLTLPKLGISQALFDRLAQKLDVIYHCGAWVNILYPYAVLKAANVLGTQEVLRLASQSRVKSVHYISTTDVFAGASDLSLQTVHEGNAVASAQLLYSGYAKSKCIAESLLWTAQKREIPVTIYRPSNIMGDGKTSTCPPASFVVQMIKGCLKIEAAPQLPAILNLVPVDYVSRAIIHLSLQPESLGQSFNLVNPQGLAWMDLLGWMQQAGYRIEPVSYEAWGRQTIAANSQTPEDVLFFLSTLFTNQPFIQKSLGSFHFEIPHLERQLRTAGIVCPTIDSDWLSAYFQSFYEEGLIAKAPLPRVLAL